MAASLFSTRVQQLSCLTSISKPCGLILDHTVDDDQQLAHSRYQRDFFGLAGGAKSLVEGLYDGVAAGSNQGAHVECSPYMLTSSPDSPFPSQFPAIPVKRRHADEGCDLLSIELPQLRQVTQEVEGESRPNPRHALQDVRLAL